MRPSRRASALRGIRQPPTLYLREIISFTSLKIQCINNRPRKRPGWGILSKPKDGSARKQVMFRFQYCVTTKASRKLAWEVFSNWRRWNEFANIYGEVAWREGKPWEAGSRLDIEGLEPVKTGVSHLITNCQPAHQMGWIYPPLAVVLPHCV